MYQMNNEGEFVEIPYTYIDIAEADYNIKSTNSGFYQVKDGANNVIESGYQHISDVQDSMFYLIALPEGVDFNKNVTVMTWNDSENKWSPTSLDMSCDPEFINTAFTENDLTPPENIPGYTLWIDATLNTCDGSDFRFIINE